MKGSKIAWAVVYLLLSKGAFAQVTPVTWSGNPTGDWFALTNWDPNQAPSLTNPPTFPGFTSNDPQFITEISTDPHSNPPYPPVNINSLTFTAATVAPSCTYQFGQNEGYTIHFSNIVGPGPIFPTVSPLITLSNNSPVQTFYTNILLGDSASQEGVNLIIVDPSDNGGISFFLPITEASGAFSSIEYRATNGGVLTLGAINTYSSGTRLVQGTISVTANDTSSTQSALGTGDILMGIEGAALIVNNSQSQLIINNDLALYDGGACLFNTGADGIVLSGVVSGGSLTVSANGVLSLTNSLNSYTGGTVLKGGGTLSVGAPTALGTGTLTMETATTLSSSQLFSEAVANNITFGGDVSISADQYPLALSGAITGGTSLAKIGAGVLQLTGPLMSGTAGIVEITEGTLVLQSANTYSGGTQLTGGTLSVGSSTALGTGPLMMQTGTLLSSSQLFSGAVANNITFGGDISISTDQSLTLSGSITGGTSISKTGAGVLQLTGPLMSGTDGIMKITEGTLVLSGANTYSGGTQLIGGTLSVGAATALGIAPLTMSSGTTLTSSQIFSGAVANEITFGGDISIFTEQLLTVSGSFGGGTSLTKTGAGMLKLSGTTNIAGTITVQAGNLSVMNQTTAAVAVNAGATLSGIGPINGNVTNNGNVVPGASIGTLTIVGDYTQGNSSTYTNEIGSTTTDLLAVQGNIAIGSGTTFAMVTDNAVAYAEGQTYTVMSATGTVSGNHFARLTTNNSQLHGLLTYPNNSVMLTIYTGSLIPVDTFTGNPGQVQMAIEKVFSEGNLLKDEIFFALLPLNSAQLYHALDQMHPAMYKGMTVAQEKNAFLVRNSVSERFQALLDDVDCLPCANSENKRGVVVWASGFGDYLHQEEAFTYNSPQAAYNATTGGVSVGMDHKIEEIYYIGVLGAYTHSSLHWNANRGHGDINSGYGGVYASAVNSLYYGNFSFIGGWSSFDAQRNIIFPGVNRTASNNHQGLQLITHLDTGLNWSYNGFTIRPFDSLDWIVQKEDKYTETGAGHYDLTVNSSFANMLRNELGFNLASCGYVSRVKLIADAKLGWVVEARMKGKNSTSKFIQTDVPFTVIGNFPTRSLLSVGGSLTAALLQELVTCTVYKGDDLDHKYVSRQDVLTMSVYYNGLFGSHYSDNSFGGSLNYGF